MKKLFALCLAILVVLGMTACGGDTQDNVDRKPVEKNVADIYVELGNVVELPEMLPLNESLMLDYCGIEVSDVKQAEVYICADSLKTDEFWLIEATNEEAAKKIVDLAKARLKTKGDESITYSPEQYAVVEKAQLLQNGNHIFLLVSPDVESMVTALESVTGTMFDKMN